MGGMRENRNSSFPSQLKFFRTFAEIHQNAMDCTNRAAQNAVDSPFTVQNRHSVQNFNFKLKTDAHIQTMNRKTLKSK